MSRAMKYKCKTLSSSPFAPKPNIFSSIPGYLPKPHSLRRLRTIHGLSILCESFGCHSLIATSWTSKLRFAILNFVTL